MGVNKSFATRLQLNKIRYRNESTVRHITPQYCNFCFPIGFNQFVCMDYPDKMQSFFFRFWRFFFFGGFWRWHDYHRNTYFLGVGNKFAKNFNTSSSFISFIHSFICSSIHPFIYYLTTVKTWVCHLSFHSFIHLFIHPSIHLLFNHGWNMGVPSFISFILLIIGHQGSNTRSIFHLIHSFVHPSIHSFIIQPLFKHGCAIFHFIHFCWLLDQGSNTCSIFHFIHSFIHLFIHPFIYYLTMVQTWVPSFISFILLIIGPRFKHVFHLSFHSFIRLFIHPFIYYLTTVQTWVCHLSFHSFCWLLDQGSNMCSIFHFIHSFSHLFIHPFIYYLTMVQTDVPSFIFIHSFIIYKHIFHLSFHSFVHWPTFVHSFIHSFIDLGYPGGTLVATLRLKS
jgi:hypothetical protein